MELIQSIQNSIPCFIRDYVSLDTLSLPSKKLELIVMISCIVVDGIRILFAFNFWLHYIKYILHPTPSEKNANNEVFIAK